MLTLNDVTLVIAETRVHELAKITANHLLAKVRFGEVLVFTDDQKKLDIPGSITRKIPDFAKQDDLLRFNQFETVKYLRTPFMLFLEWDAGLCDVAMWHNGFLEYDFIGAPWWFTDGSPNVGNGGFSLRSKRLMQFLSDHRETYPALTDNQMCRDYGPKIIEHGKFNWASVQVANDFSLEGFDRLGLPNNLEHFGYHYSNNWPMILSRDDLIERFCIMYGMQYMSERGFIQALLKSDPWLLDIAKKERRALQ